MRNLTKLSDVTYAWAPILIWYMYVADIARFLNFAYLATASKYSPCLLRATTDSGNRS